MKNFTCALSVLVRDFQSMMALGVRVKLLLEMDGEEERGDGLKVRRGVSYFERRCRSLYG